MIACLLIPGFTLRAALRSRPRLALVPAALAPEPAAEKEPEQTERENEETAQPKREDLIETFKRILKGAKS